jgi:MFS family permease
VSAFPPERRGQVLGWGVGFVYVGLSAGPVLGGIIDHFFGWRAIFIVTAVLAAAAWALAVRNVPDDRHGRAPLRTT